ncbi:MAG: HEAT repeat domain-containing protein, partial [Candidatus Thorarchaeota archaeon]
MSIKDIKKQLEEGNLSEIVNNYQLRAIEALGSILSQEKSLELQKSAIKAYQQVSEQFGPLSRREIKPFIDALTGGKINPNCKDNLVTAIETFGDLAVSELIKASITAKGNMRLFFFDLLNDLDKKLITETILAEKITSPASALCFEILCRTYIHNYFDIEQTVYDHNLDYTLDIQNIKEILIDGLNNKENEVTIKTVEIMGQYPTVSLSVLQNLVNLLNSSNDNVLISKLLKTIGALGSETAIDAINKKTTKEFPKEIRLAAIDAAGNLKISNQKAISNLITENLFDIDEDIRFRTINTLGIIGAPAAPILVDLLQREQNIQPIEIALKRIGEPAIPQLLNAMVNKKTRKNAIDLAKLILTPKYGFSGTVSKLIEHLSDKDKEVQEEVINTIIEMGEPGLESVIFSLASDNQKIRTNANEILNKFGIMNIHLFIERTIKDRAKFVQACELIAVLSIYQLDDDLRGFAFDQFEELLTRVDYNIDVQQAIFENILHNIEKDPDPDIRFAFAQAAYYLGQSSIPRLKVLLNDKDTEIVQAALDSLGLLKNPDETIIEIVKKFRDKDKNIRLAAVRALGNLESNEVIPYLIDILNDPDPEVQDIASEAIHTVGEAGLPALIENMDHKDSRMRIKIAELISSYGELAWEPLIQRMNIPNLNFQETAIDIIANLGESFADRLLTVVQTTMDENVQSVAIQGLAKMQYLPALPYIVNSLQNESKKIHQSIAKALEFYKNQMTEKILDDLEKVTGNAEKTIIDFLQKEANPRFTVIP